MKVIKVSKKKVKLIGIILFSIIYLFGFYILIAYPEDQDLVNLGALLYPYMLIATITLLSTMGFMVYGLLLLLFAIVSLCIKLNDYIKKHIKWDE